MLVLRNAQNGGFFSDDRAAYLCPKCVAMGNEYRSVVAEIDRDREAILNEESRPSGPFGSEGTGSPV